MENTLIILWIFITILNIVIIKKIKKEKNLKLDLVKSKKIITELEGIIKNNEETIINLKSKLVEHEVYYHKTRESALNIKKYITRLETSIEEKEKQINTLKNANIDLKVSLNKKNL